MKRNKYNWNELKTKYISWQIEDVKEFIRQELGNDRVNDGNINRHTNGRKEARKQYWKNILNNYEPPFESISQFKKELDEAIKFLPILIRSFRVWIVRNIEKWKFPTIDQVIKYAELLSNYTGFRLGSLSKNDYDNTDFDPLRERLNKIEKKQKYLKTNQ